MWRSWDRSLTRLRLPAATWRRICSASPLFVRTWATSAVASACVCRWKWASEFRVERNDGISVVWESNAISQGVVVRVVVLSNTERAQVVGTLTRAGIG